MRTVEDKRSAEAHTRLPEGPVEKYVARRRYDIILILEGMKRGTWARSVEQQRGAEELLPYAKTMDPIPLVQALGALRIHELRHTLPTSLSYPLHELNRLFKKEFPEFIQPSRREGCPP